MTAGRAATAAGVATAAASPTAATGPAAAKPIQGEAAATTPDADQTRGDAGVHGFWQRGRPCVFDIRITDTDCRPYHNKAWSRVLADHKREKKGKYLQACHARRKDFTPLLYSVDGVQGHGREANMAEKQLASHLAQKWHKPLE